jgi:RHH-type transcriptional regulator, proline utilization regulon repressor / proline dehydrogenase / delta 1-pyrroline-5-carboxylate dehydrogenase
MIPLQTLYGAADRDEATAVRALLPAMDPGQRASALETGRALVAGARTRADERPYLDAFLQEFGLSNQEGIALMCLAEALLRIPDDATADRLIAEKLAGGDWSSHAGRSDSLFVNASTWALMLTGGLVDLPSELQRDTGGWFRGLARRVGDPIVRQALRRGMRIIGGEFVVGRTIGEALGRSGRERELSLCSFDMLGEGARTDEDANRYLESYRRAILAIGAAGRKIAGEDPHARSSISIKLSALDPRYSLTQQERVHARLIPRALELARLAAREGLALTVDAEEADRLEISLEVIEALARDRETSSWPGLGLAIQAYGRRAPVVIDWVAALSRESGRRMSVRLVKGAYWDSEIKRAQERGLREFPVYTRKVSTDVAWLACARRLFAAAPAIYPQFATHNAHSIGAVLAMRGAGCRCEFQRLHGMGRLIYDEAQRIVADFPPVRVYAPVGQHADLLAYLVRRLLENGANTSFVNRFMDERVPVEAVVADPIAQLEALSSIPHPDIPLPVALYGAARRNSRGSDFGESRDIDALEASVKVTLGRPLQAAENARMRGTVITNPADRRDVVGEVQLTTATEVAGAIASAAAAQPAWNDTPAGERAACLLRAADLLEQARDRFMPLLVREAGKTLPDAIAEIREAADFCRFYAGEAQRLFSEPAELNGPTGESNRLILEGRGVFACISPWNFPLAIFTGQITAALAAGNCVVAKPSEATALTGAAMIGILHQAGIPADNLHYLPMEGRVFGEAALGARDLSGVVFTGSTATGQWLNRALAARPGPILPLIAETGGLNAMIVDSTALSEQVVDDAISSAFLSAGQRCSALRLLFLQEDVADRIIEMLIGAMDELVIGDPALAATDVGPVISERAAAVLLQHVDRMKAEARILHACTLDERHAHGSFVAPHLIELRDARALTSEQFGPLLHLVRYRASDLEQVIGMIRESGYGLTLGVQTRLESTWQRVFRATTTGNTYVNRNMIGAVVGVQPFGGSGLSGTGPKAGGPHYLARFASERTLTVNTTATGGNAALLRLG